MARRTKKTDAHRIAMRQKMDAQLQYNEHLLKEIQASYRSEMLDSDKEALEAEKTLYRTWWDYLQAYKKAKQDEGIRAQAEVGVSLNLFGDLALSFRDWWKAYGRALFIEREELPIVRVVDMDDEWGPNEFPKHITLRIPLTITAAGIRTQIDQLLEICQPKRVMPHKGSGAKMKIHPRGAYHHQHYKDLLSLWKHRQSNPNDPLWKIGHDKGLCPTKNPYDSDQREKDEARRQLDTAAAKQLKQAEALMHFAVRGEFPREK